MSVKPSIILYGAFDRYNYGDNLMPVLFEQYLIHVNKKIFEKYEIVYASIQQSDLSKYACKPTIPIKKLLNSPQGSILVVVGGETMGAHIKGLYLHTFDNKKYHKIASFLMKYTKYFFTLIAKIKYPSPWIFPYIPNKSSFNHDVKIILNTVGGIPPKRTLNTLKKMDYISVRDLRSYRAIKEVVEAKLVPDSVLLLSSLFSIEQLFSSVSNQVKEQFDFSKDYIVIQMCPYKASCTVEQMAKVLMEIKETKGVEPILLPIGYASGHDDIDFLQKVSEASNGTLKLFYDLTIWEIAYFIANSKGFYGTSLHGVITAMSYQVPHFCINAQLEKLVSFLDTWSIEPFSRAINPQDISSYISLHYDKALLTQKVDYAQDCIEQHYNHIIDLFIEV